MLFWFLLALSILVISLLIAYLSMRSVASEEMSLFNSQLPPQPKKGVNDAQPAESAAKPTNSQSSLTSLPREINSKLIEKSNKSTQNDISSFINTPLQNEPEAHNKLKQAYESHDGEVNQREESGGGEVNTGGENVRESWNRVEQPRPETREQTIVKDATTSLGEFIGEVTIKKSDH